MQTLAYHYNKHCGHKIAHVTKEVAEREAIRLGLVTRDRLYAYHCKYCGKWHVGHRQWPFEVR